MRVFLIVGPRMRIWLPIHPGEVQKRKSTPHHHQNWKKATRRWCSASGFDLVAARTRHVWALVPRPCRVLFMSIFRESTLLGEIVSGLTNVVGEEYFLGEKRTYIFGAGSKFTSLADVRGRRSTTKSPHPHGVRALVLLNRTSLLQPPWLSLVWRSGHAEKLQHRGAKYFFPSNELTLWNKQLQNGG